MGKAGSEPPPMHDEDDDNRVAFVIAEMHRGAGSLGSFVALKVDLESRGGYSVVRRDHYYTPSTSRD